jgi:PKD repeat protein
MKQLMKLAIAFLVVFSTGMLSAQIDQGGKPISFELKTLNDNIDNVFIYPPNIEEAKKEHDYLEKNGEMYRVSVLLDVNISMQTAGTWDILEDGTKVWRLRITSEDAKALSLHYNKFYLPEGSSLFLYNENKAQVAGAFTALNNPGLDRRFSTRIIQGETTTLEYIQPPHVTDEAILDINQISYFYRGVSALVGFYKKGKPTGFGDSGDCNVNVNCPEGDDWQNEKNGVALIYIPGGMGGGFCTGSLVNNTAEDGTPYFLTADHCGGDQTNQDQWEFYFNFESPDCSDPASEPGYDDIVGADKIARGPQSGGTDFLLLELLTTPPASYNIYYNGWDRTDVGATNTIGIHHPSGDIMKISRSGAATVTTWSGGMTNAHWEVTWQSTATDWGVTEGGSSGSPFFDETTKRIVGTLTGGDASCTNQSAPDAYGRFDYHWEENGAADTDQLAPWLDPVGSDPASLDGYDPNAVASEPVADFEANPTNLAPGGTVDFTDLSTPGDDPIQSWSWEFGGVDPPDDTSTDQNPTGIPYNTPGTFNVTLTIDDGTFTDVEEKTGYIVVEDNPGGLNAMFEPSEDEINVGDCISFQDQSTGSPNSWTWTFENGNPPDSDQQNPTNICYDSPGIFDVILEISDGTDTDTDTCVGCIIVGDPATAPMAGFYADATVIPEGGVVTFTDTSVNGPFTEWAWSFEGGLPDQSENEGPVTVAYMDAGVYDVELRVKHDNNSQYIETKEDYITVVPAADDPPEANFIANYTVIQPGETVDFHDISSGAPYQWKWTFEGAFTPETTDQHPDDILYEDEGEWDVTMIAKNSEGNDTVIKEDYIIVSVDDPCNDTVTPVADFTCSSRLLSAGDITYFEDLSTGYPQTWNWVFGPNAIPTNSTQASPLSGVEYNIPGIYDVTLSVNNSCGGSVKTKEDYIYVFSGPVQKYCDTLTNLKTGETASKMNTPGTWGFIAGHNGERVRTYADYFDDHSFSQIEALIVPVNNSVYGSYNSYVRFYIWDGDTEFPNEDNILAEKKKYIRNMPENYNSVIEFDNPVQIDGPFFVGFKLFYPDENGDGISDDYFVVSTAGNRGSSESNNTMVVDKSGWKTSVELFNISTSLAIKPIACLLDLDEFDIEKNIHAYPNPTAGNITLELGDEYINSDVEIKVYDMTGRQLFITPTSYNNIEYRLDLSNNSPGMYFLEIRIDNNIVTKKISVMR